MILFTDYFYVHGHTNVLGTHKTTLEFTKDEDLSSKGDCIIGIKSTKSFPDFNSQLKKYIKLGKKIIIKLDIDGIEDEIIGWGHPELTLSDISSMIIRKSDYICPRTLMIRADKSAININRKLIEKLTNPNTKMMVSILIED